MKEHELGGSSVEELILADLDHALAPDLERALQAHLRDCAACRALERRHRGLHERLRQAPGEAALARAREDIWSGIEGRRVTSRWTSIGVLGRVALAAVLIVAAALVGSFIAERGRVAAPPPSREEVARLSFDLSAGGGSGTLVVEQGSALARPGMEIGVGARAELRFARPVGAGSAELRFQEERESSYGVIASARDLAGVASASFGGSFPRPAGEASPTYRVWVHVEADGSTDDTAPLLIEIVSLARGEEARQR